MSKWTALCMKYVSHGLGAQAELFLAPGVNPRWQNFTFTDSVFSEGFVFLPYAFVFVSDSRPNLIWVLVCTQPMVPLGGSTDRDVGFMV